MTNHARNGRAREHRVADYMESCGWLQAMRAAGSKGAADLAMVHPFFGLAWVQVGTAKSKTLGPDARDRLCSLAEATGALALLVTTVPGQRPTAWQVTRETASKWRPWPMTPLPDTAA